MTELELLSMRIFLLKVLLKNGQEKYLLLILFWKLSLELKDLHGENIIESFYEKELLISVL